MDPPSTSARYLSTPFGGSSVQPRRRIDVAEGQVVSDVEIKLEVAAAISGRVVDDNGEPLANVRVHAVRLGAGSRPQRTSS